MKVLVTGARGQLGSDLVRLLENRGVRHRGTDIDDFSITDFQSVHKELTDYRPDVVIHCAAYTAVDLAETEKDRCAAINVDATENIAKFCRELGAKMLYISTDYVFPGMGDRFYETTDTPSPINHYGMTKYQGEMAVQKYLDRFFIVRISWVFGENGSNFIKTMLRIGKNNQEVKVVSDQYGSPTYTADLAELLVDMAETEKYGIYHATNEGVCTWAELARETFSAAGYQTKVIEISSDLFESKAVRPHNSRLSKVSLDQGGFHRLRHWREAAREFVGLVTRP